MPALLGLATRANAGAAAAWACISLRATGNSTAAFLALIAPNFETSAAIASGFRPALRPWAAKR
ncbi:hypothetical protein D3C72_1151630 [compost metagenome]